MKEFTLSMFKNKEDLYLAKSQYFEELASELIDALRYIESSLEIYGENEDHTDLLMSARPLLKDVKMALENIEVR